MEIPDALTLFWSGLPVFMFGRFMYKNNYRIGFVYTDLFEDRSFQVNTQDGIMRIQKGFEVLSCSSETKPPCGKIFLKNFSI